MLATFQVQNNHMWLVASVVGSTDIEHFHCCRALWKALLYSTGQQSVACGWSPAHLLGLQIKLYWKTATPIILYII